MNIVMACAGTGGHINPAIAIANIIKEKNDESNILFIGTKTGLENELVKNAGYEIKHIRSTRILHKFTLKNIKAIYTSYAGINDAKTILKEFNADIVIGTGGYICGPAMIAARCCKIPYILHESNAYPGLTVKLLARKAAAIMVGFKEAKEKLRYKKNVVWTGTPIRYTKRKIQNLDMNRCKAELKLTDRDIGENRKIIFVTGGSQGAKILNESVLQMINKYMDKKLYIVLVTGSLLYDDIVRNLNNIEKATGKDFSEYICVKKYVYDMDKMYKVSDLCITRSGAMTINELTAFEKKAVLIPFLKAAENHQMYNAKVLEKIGLAEIIEETKLNEDTLYTTINKALQKPIVNIKENEILADYINNNVEKNILNCIIEVLKKNKV